MMKLIDILSLILFIIFFMSYVAKLLILYRKHHISANVLGKGNKGKEIDKTEITVRIVTFIWGIVWVIESLANNFVRGIFKDLFTGYFIRYIGITIIFIGVSIFILAMGSMKTSWRVGIDKKTKSKLVTVGLYKYSRNPAFVGFDLMFLGLFLTYANILTLFVLIINVLSIHRLILQEEKHLQGMFNEDYKEYKKRTPRYLIF